MTQKTLITLTTDFGLNDEYVGVMKGVIAGLAPSARVIDLCHQIAPQDIGQAAALLAASYRYFPANSLHVVVVDPGVGSARKIVLVKCAGHFFLAPDNGLLTAVLRDTPCADAWQVNRRELFLPVVSNTFHGRDIFAPVAARLATGLQASAVGPPIEPDSLINIALPVALLNHHTHTITGRITGRDRFGNLLTNIHQNDIAGLVGDQSPRALFFTVAGHAIDGLTEDYRTRETGALLAIIGSRGFVEIAASRASAADLLCAATGQSVIVTLAS